jgi:hypothetical protein
MSRNVVPELLSQKDASRNRLPELFSGINLTNTLPLRPNFESFYAFRNIFLRKTAPDNLLNNLRRPYKANLRNEVLGK